MVAHPTLRRLNDDWARLASLPLPQRWRTEPALADCPDLAAVLAAVRPRPDEVLGALLGSGDYLARRVVLQAMLGRAVRDAAGDRGHDLDEYVGELWLVITGYPLHRRPTSIAANLALDAAKRVRVKTRATPVDPAGLWSLPGPEREAPRRAALLLARARRADLLDESSHAALSLVYTSGLPSAEAARVLGLTPAALRQRCHRAVRRLAAHADLLGEAVG